MAFDLSGPISMTNLIERATTELLIAPDWTINMQICDECAKDAEFSKEAVRQLMKKIKDKNPQTGLYALFLLEALMKNSYHVVHIVHSKEHQAALIKIVKDKKTKYQIKDKLLDMIQSWGEGFQSSTQFPNFWMTFHSLRREGLPFAPSPSSPYVPPSQPAVSQRFVHTTTTTTVGRSPAPAPSYRAHSL